MAKYRARCCNDILESKFLHDFVACRCGKTYVDGGDTYTRTGFIDEFGPPERLPNDDG